MKLSRLIHSCLLIEDSRANLLIDPSNFSWQDKKVQVASLPKIDYILITHKHADHLEPEFIRAVLGANPEAIVIGNSESVEELESFDIEAQTNSPDWIELTTLEHPTLWRGMPGCKNTVFTLWDELTVFGDNRQLDKVNFAETVAFPIVAPWGSLVEAIDLLLETPPKRVIPLHDWHLSEAGQAWYYQRLSDTLTGHGIEFVDVKPTESIDL